MKKRILLFVAIMAMLVCVFALSVSAAEPDTTKESVTLSDGKECALWDTEGNPLIWYITSTTDGVNTYAYVPANSSNVDYYCSWSDSSYGVTVNQVTKVTITVDGVSYDKNKIVVLNMKGDVKVTSGKSIGNPVDCFRDTFTSSTSIQYVYFPLSFKAFNSASFKNCSNLVYANLPELTELRGIGEQDFNVGTCEKFFAGKVLDLSSTKISQLANGAIACSAATEIILPETLTTVANWVFQYNAYITRMDLPETMTTFGSTMFNGCKRLKTVTGFKRLLDNKIVTNISGSTFAGCNALESVDGLLENGILTIPKDFTTIDSFAFSGCTKVKYLSLPSTINFVGQAAFQDCTDLEFIDFNNNKNNINFSNCQVFSGCKNLKAVSLPDNVTYLTNRIFSHCTNLQAVYLPSATQIIESNGYGHAGAFSNCPKLFFVNEPFEVSDENGNFYGDSFVMPDKPEVYFFPSNLQSLYDRAEGVGFSGCISLNSVMVLPETLTKLRINDGAFYECGTKNSPKTIVMLGDMTDFCYSSQNSRVNYLTFVFANENDIDIGSINAVNNNTNGIVESYMYFCKGGCYYKTPVKNATPEKLTGTLHIVNPKATETTDPSCVKNSVQKTFCFCTVPIGEVELENTKLGHDERITALEYTNYLANGIKTVGCSRCTEYSVTSDASPLIVFHGYSAKENNTAICADYTVEYKLLAIYEELTGKKITFGVVACASDNLVNKDNKPIKSDGYSAEVTSGKVVNNTVENVRGGITVKLKTTDWSNFADKNMILCAYIIENGNVGYICNTAEITDTGSPITYNQIVGTVVGGNEE